MISLTGAKAELGKLNLRAANSPVQMNELVARDNVLTWHVSICVQKISRHSSSNHKPPFEGPWEYFTTECKYHVDFFVSFFEASFRVCIRAIVLGSICICGSEKRVFSLKTGRLYKAL